MWTTLACSVAPIFALRSEDETMSLQVFLRGLIILLVVFMGVTYLTTGSARTTLVNTMICAGLVQIGYFVVVVFMVWRTPRFAQVTQGTAIAPAGMGTGMRKVP